MSNRLPSVSGIFYSSDQNQLKKSIEDACSHVLSPNNTGIHKSRCAIAPHAGYQYSAHIACHSIRALKESKVKGPVIILGPEHAHTQIGASVSTVDQWETPLGSVKVAKKPAQRLSELSDILVAGDEAHDTEHSIEVQIPLLQHMYSNTFEIIPVSISDQGIETATSVGIAAAKIALEFEGVILASSDLTHYESDSSARKKDAALTKCITDLDVNAMYNTLDRLKISACGYGPIAASMIAAKYMGAKKGIELAYATSADSKEGTQKSVVGYSSVIFE